MEDVGHPLPFLTSRQPDRIQTRRLKTAPTTMLWGDEIMTNSETRKKTGAKSKDRGQLHECDWWRMWPAGDSEEERHAESSEIRLMQTRWEGGMRQKKKMYHLSFQKVKRCEVVILEQRWWKSNGVCADCTKVLASTVTLASRSC